jgi:hypothetical protein
MPRIAPNPKEGKNPEDPPYQLQLSLSLDNLAKLALDFEKESSAAINEVPLSKKSLSSDQLSRNPTQKIVEIRVDAKVGRVMPKMTSVGHSLMSRISRRRRQLHSRISASNRVSSKFR